MEMGELPRVLEMYERAIAAFPDALLEDAHDLPEVAALLAGEADRISYDAPIHSVADIGATPLAPRALNIKPCRVGDLRSLLAVYDDCASRGLLMYGGGMGELGVGRDQIQLLASLFHADGPNDTAPSGYNADTPAPRSAVESPGPGAGSGGVPPELTPVDRTASSWTSTRTSAAPTSTPDAGSRTTCRSGRRPIAPPRATSSSPASCGCGSTPSQPSLATRGRRAAGVEPPDLDVLGPAGPAVGQHRLRDDLVVMSAARRSGACTRRRTGSSRPS